MGMAKAGINDKDEQL
jgi:hypothetical protein